MTDTPLTPTASVNLEYYKKQAKALLKAARADNAAARERMGRFDDGGETALHLAQRVIAHEQGFASWPRFHAFIVESRLDFKDLIARFLAAATSDGRRARDMLAEHPQIAGAGVYVALVLGDRKMVAEAIAADLGWVNAKSGPENVEPLVYVCFSRFAHPRSERAAKLVQTCRLLLEGGADPDTAFEGEDGKLSCLYAASGLLNNIELTRLLLEAGANPNDNESLYHATEHADLTCLKLLLEHGGDANTTNVLKHMLDWESAEGVRLLLEAGADPNAAHPEGDTALHWAVRRGRSAGIVRVLIDAGADLDAVRKDGRTAYALAVVSGQTEVADLLAVRGADTRLSALDGFIAGRGGEVPKASAASKANARLFTQLAESGNAAAVEALLKAGVPVGAKGDGGITALHYACWRGHVALVKLLLEHGAPMNVKDDMYGGLPAGFLHHGSTNCGEGDYAACARLLIAAGGWTESEPSGNAALDAVLREKGMIA